MDTPQITENNVETEAISRIIEGETFLFEAIVRRYNSYLYRVGRSYGFNHQEVEDLMQETYLSAYVNLRQFEHRSSFKTWIVRIMLNHCYHKVHKLSFQRETATEQEIQEKSIPMFNHTKDDTEKTVLNDELKIVLENAVERIPLDYRIVFALRELNGLSVLETAEALNITQSNVKVRLNRAKLMLRKEIQKLYSMQDVFDFNLIYCDAMVQRVMETIGKHSIS